MECGRRRGLRAAVCHGCGFYGSIARVHDEILSTIFRGVKIRASVESIRFLRPDVAVAEFTLESDNFPFGVRRSMPVMVATKGKGAWSIAVTI